MARKHRRFQPVFMENLERRELLSASFAIFDESYYLAHNPDVADAVNKGVFTSGLQHFEEYGMYEDRSPSPFWDEHFYLSTYIDLGVSLQAQGFVSPVEHFILYGDAENRTPTPLFSPTYYQQTNPDVAAAVASGAFVSAFDHFVLYGDHEERAPNVTMNPSWYEAQNPDVANAIQLGTITSATDHFLAFGQFEGRQPSPLFNQGFYLASNPDVQTEITSGQFASAYEEWRTEGLRQGRLGSTAAYQLGTIVGANETPVAISSQNVVVGSSGGLSSAAGPSVGGAANLAGINATDVAYYGVVGQSISPESTGVATGRAVFRMTDGTLIDLGNLSDESASPVNSTIPAAITDNNFIVGASMVWNTATNTHDPHPFFWEQSTGIMDLGLPAAPDGYNGAAPYYTGGFANSVNAERVVVGRVVVNSSIMPATQYAFMWSPQTGFKVFTAFSNFLDVSDNGVIVAADQSGSSALVDLTGAVISAAPPAVGSASGATTAVSNTGVAVGFAVNAQNPEVQNTTATIRGKTYLVNDLFYDPIGTNTFQFFGPASINDKGDIAVQATINGSSVVALTLVPTVGW